MNRKKLLVLCLTISTTSLIFFTSSLAIKNNKKIIINNSIIERVNSHDFLNSETLDNNTESKILFPISNYEAQNKDDSYSISINYISNGDLDRVIIENSLYYKYLFTANVTVHNNKDNSNYTKDIESNVILSKSNGKYKIKSMDDFKSHISKEIIDIKNKNSEDISKELSNLSLLYNNEELDIQIHYPDYYTYTNNIIAGENNYVENTVSFYSDEDKSTNYITISMSTNPELNHKDIIAKFKKINYTIDNTSFKTENGLDFIVLKQSFTEDTNDITELVYIAKQKYKDISVFVATARMDTEILKNKQNEIDEIIKSIK